MSGWGAIFNSTQSALRMHMQELQRLQEMVASGARVNRPSDAPVDALKILQFRSDVQSVETYTKNIDSVADSLQMVSTVLQGLSDALIRVRSLATQVTGITDGSSAQPAIACEIDNLLEQMVSLANTAERGRYLFSGAAGTAPYAVTRENGQIVRVDYCGGSDPMAVPVAGGVDYGAVLVGREVFQSDARQDPLFLGHTGAAAGQGTASACGDVWLTAVHTATTYQGASGVAAGDSSAAGDTILGTGHTLTIDEPNHTLQLDDGTLVTFTGAETDLRLTDASGDVAYVNVTGLAAGFQGTVAVRADGTLSLDDGTTVSAIGFTAADGVTDSRTGGVLYVDTTAIARTGLEPVRIPGTYDLFGTLINLRDAILNSRGLSSADRNALLDEAGAAVKEVTGRVTQTMTLVGAQLGSLDTLKQNLANVKDVSQEQASTLESADIVEVATDLARLQTLYEMTLQSAAKLLSLSLFDYLP
jgi:flagellar hook-associated protein 3